MKQGEERKAILMELGVDVLAETLLKLADSIEEADDVVVRMTSTADELVERFRRKLLTATRTTDFISLRETTGYERKLESLLDDIVDVDSVTGVNLMANFYEADRDILDQCDDSDGTISGFFSFTAVNLFVTHATHHPDKKQLANIVLDLCRDDDYGVRRDLMDRASEYLPVPVIRSLIDSLRGDADRKEEVHEKRQDLSMIESLARQVGDAELFEQTRIASWGEPNDAACLDIARVYFDAGNVTESLSWLERITPDSNRDRERDRLLLTVFDKLDRTEERNRIALDLFKTDRSVTSLDEYLHINRNANRGDVIAAEIADIHAVDQLLSSNAKFLTELGLVDEAETYLLHRADQIDGDLYFWFAPLAEFMDAHGRSMCATVLYRALLNSILERGQSRTYHHGVRYLKRLDRLAPEIADWLGHVDHARYFESLRQYHGRKRSFWQGYS